MLEMIGIVVLAHMSVRLALWGRRRSLPRPWLAWLPLGAPVIWLAGSLWAAVTVRDRVAYLGELPANDRALVLSNELTDALQLTLAAAIAAIALLATCFAFFASRPRVSDEDIAEDGELSPKEE